MSERALWAAVVYQAALDATREFPPSLPESERHECRKARIWFEQGGSDFRQVCDLAGYDPDWLREKFLSGLITQDGLKGRPRERAPK